MPRYIKIEENEDGTITGSMNVGDQEMNFVLDLPFEALLTTMGTLALRNEEAAEHLHQVTESIVMIPDGPEGL